MIEWIEFTPKLRKPSKLVLPVPAVKLLPKCEVVDLAAYRAARAKEMKR